MYLIIDTSNIEKLFVGLIVGKKLKSIKAQAKYKQAEKLLYFIDKILKENKATTKDLQGILVVSGPGGFTTVRIGVVMANAMAWALKIKIASIKNTEFKNEKQLVEKGMQKLNKAKTGQIILPFYDKEPNITKPKIINNL